MMASLLLDVMKYIFTYLWFTFENTWTKKGPRLVRSFGLGWSWLIENCMKRTKASPSRLTTRQIDRQTDTGCSLTGFKLFVWKRWSEWSNAAVGESEKESRGLAERWTPGAGKPPGPPRPPPKPWLQQLETDPEWSCEWNIMSTSQSRVRKSN